MLLRTHGSRGLPRPAAPGKCRMPGVVRTPRTALPSLRLWWPSEVRFTISDLAGPELCYEETAAQFNSTLGAAVLFKGVHLSAPLEVFTLVRGSLRHRLPWCAVGRRLMTMMTMPLLIMTNQIVMSSGKSMHKSHLSFENER